MIFTADLTGSGNRSEEVLKSQSFHRHIDVDIRGVSTCVRNVQLSWIELNGTLTVDGVFSIDTLLEDPHLLVCNTDPSDKPGRHWIAIYIKDGRGDFLTRLWVDLISILNDIWSVTVCRGILTMHSHRVSKFLWTLLYLFLYSSS